MATPDRWTEIRKLHVDWKDAYRILGGVVLVGIGIVIGAGWFANPQADGYTTNLYTEFISIGITVFILDFLNRRRDDRRRIEDLKAQLLRQVRSPEPAIRNHAIHEIRDQEWLTGENGLLKEANLGLTNLKEADLGGANLQGVDFGGANLKDAILGGVNLKDANLTYANLREARLMFANLQGVRLVFANLREARLMFANLQEVDLRFANLKDADLRDVQLQGATLADSNLQGAYIDGANFDTKTVLPDAQWDDAKQEYTPDSYWTPETDMRRYTDPDHPEFWQPPQRKHET